MESTDKDAHSRMSDERNDKADPTHIEETKVLVRHAFDELNPLGKALFIATAIYTMLVLALPKRVLYNLGIRSNERHFRLKRVTTSPHVFIGEYVMPHHESNCVVVKGKDGKLLIRSPPPLLPNVVEQIVQEGEVGALLVNTAHDTYADMWKEVFPNAKILGMKHEIPTLNNRVKVDMALEDANEFLENYHIVKVIPESPYLRYGDFTLLIQLEDGAIVASVGCGVLYDPSKSWWNPLSWPNLLAGENGFGYKRVFCLAFARDLTMAREAWLELSKTPGLRGLLFLHGEPLIREDVPQLMAKATFEMPFPVLRS